MTNQVQLNELEREVLRQAALIEELEKSQAWKLILDKLSARAESAEQRRDANLSHDEKLSHHLQVIARERRGTIEWLKAWVSEVKRERRGILAETMGVPVEEVEEALR